MDAIPYAGGTGDTATTATAHPSAPSPDAKAAAAENLRFAISDHQEIIRGTDIKAEVMALVVAAVLTVLTLEKEASAPAFRCLGITSVIASLLTIGFVGLVLWPRSNPLPSVPFGNYKPSEVLYPPLKPRRGETLGSWADASLATDWVNELTYELHKLVSIRASKQRWYRCALIAAALSIIAAAVRLFL